MDIFFANTRPGKIVTHGDIRFELPILYFRDDLFMLYFTANAKKIRAITPSNKLHPVIMPNGKAIIIEDDAMPFEGYIGQDREAKHTTEYTGQER